MSETSGGESKTFYISSGDLDLIPEARQRINSALLAALQTHTYHESAGQWYQDHLTRKVTRSRFNNYAPPENTGWNVDQEPRLSLSERSEAQEVRKSIFRKPQRQPWSPAEYTLEAYLEASEQLTSARIANVIFIYSPESVTGVSVVGDRDLYERMKSSPDADITDVFIEQINKLANQNQG